jgi:hypothetical protein
MNDSVVLENYFYWQNRNSYLELMERFINDKIDVEQFICEFFTMWRVDRDKYHIYNLFPDKIREEFPEFPHKINDVELSKIEDFSGLMSKLFTDCDVFEADPAVRKEYEISEEDLRNFVKKAYLEILYKYLYLV